MRRSTCRWTGFWVLAILAAHIVIANDEAIHESLTDMEYRRLLKELRPADDERWRTIPWKTSLLDGQHQAVIEDKPIFIWAMDGHPLGCT